MTCSPGLVVSTHVAGGLDEVVQRLGGGGRVQHGSGHEVVDVGRVDQVQGQPATACLVDGPCQGGIAPLGAVNPHDNSAGVQLLAHDRLPVFPERLSASVSLRARSSPQARARASSPSASGPALPCTRKLCGPSKSA